MSFLFGTEGQKPEAFRGPGWQQQGDLLNQLLIGNVLSAYPQYQQSFQSGIGNLQNQSNAINERLSSVANQFQPSLKYKTFEETPFYKRNAPQLDNLNQQISSQQRILSTSNPSNGQSSPFQSQYFNPGQQIAGQMPTVQFEQRNPYQFTNPQMNFSQMQLTPFNAANAVQDAFTPQFENAQRIFQRQGQLEDRNIQEDLNRRGLLTAGATTQELANRRERTGDQLSNIAAQLMGQQANARLGAEQFGANLGFQQQQALGNQNFQQQTALANQDFQRQVNQAAEVFRQQGASDAQAMQMAASALQNRQAALGEFSLANQVRRQPIQDLMQLYGFSTGATPGYDAQPGLLQGLAGGAGTALGGMVGAGFGGLGPLAMLACLPEDTKIETKDGNSFPVQDLRVGDYVKGGKILAVFSRQRSKDHFFSTHKFDTGEVVMTFGHPYFDHLRSVEKAENDSPNTYDILTEEGFYYVNGVKLGSTLEVLRG